MRAMRRFRGTTLIELMVASAISLVVMTAALALLWLLLRKVFWVEESSDRQLQALSALEGIRRDVLRGAAEGVSVDAAGPCLSLAQQDPVASNQRLWLTNPIVYGNENGGGLIRCEKHSSGPPGDSPPFPNAAAMQQILTAPDWGRRKFGTVRLSEVKFMDGKVVIGLQSPIRDMSGELKPQTLTATLAFRL